MGGAHLPRAGYYRLLSAWRGLFYVRKVMEMVRIISGVVLDILPHASGFLFAEMTFDEGGEEKVCFFSYEQDKQDCFPVTAKTYLTHKFGPYYRDVIDEIGDFISCDAAPLGKNGTAIVYESGEMYIFDGLGKQVWKGVVSYQHKSIRDLAVDGKDIWCVVPERNAVICYSPAEARVTLRIGGMDSAAFDEPVSISKNENLLYVSSRKARKVRTIRLPDYEVADHCKFREPVHKFFKVGGCEYAVLDSGVYEM